MLNETWQQREKGGLTEKYIKEFMALMDTEKTLRARDVGWTSPITVTCVKSFRLDTSKQESEKAEEMIAAGEFFQMEAFDGQVSK